jgi:peptide/nickel transport system substrate-binding protein
VSRRGAAAGPRTPHPTGAVLGRWLVLAVLAVMALLGACSREAATDRERVIRIAVPLVPPAIGNPYQGVTIPTTLALQGIFDTVTMVDGDGNPTPGLAIAWEQQDPLHWVFRLRPGVTFSNGEPLTADALVESARHMASKRGRAETIGSTLAQVAAVERIDDLTARIVLVEPDPLLPLHASLWRVPAPAHWRTLELPAQARNAIGSGPFVLAGREEGRLVLKANPRAWRKPAVPTIELLTIPDATARLQAFVSGAVDIAMVLSRDNRSAAERGGGRMVTRLTPQVDFIGFLTERRDTPLRDPRVRRALSLAVDRGLLTEHLLGGATHPASQLSVPGAFGFDAALPPLPHDPALARQLLAAAGHGGGLRLKMIVTTGEVAGDTVYFQQIGSDLRKVGVEVEIRNRPSTRQLQELFSGNLQGDLFSFNTRGTDPLMDFRHRSCLNSKAGRLPFHCDAALTGLLQQAQGEQDLTRRRGLYARIAAYERDNPPGILLWQRPDFDAVAAHVAGYAPVQDLIGLERLSRVASR